MSLAKYKRVRTEIVAGEITFHVGPLSLSDFARLRERHVVRLFEAIEAYKPALLHPDESQRHYGSFAVISCMAEAIGELIAIAAGEPNQVDAARNLPIGVQIRALIEILKLSAGGEDFGGATPSIISWLSRFEEIRPEDLN